jgi:hypothetical protein
MDGCGGWGTSQRTARVRGRGVGLTPCAAASASEVTRWVRHVTRVCKRTASAGGAGGAGSFSFASASAAGAGDALARAGVARLRALAGDLPAPALRGRSGVVRPARSESRRQTMQQLSICETQSCAAQRARSAHSRCRSAGRARTLGRVGRGVKPGVGAVVGVAHGRAGAEVVPPRRGELPPRVNGHVSRSRSHRLHRAARAAGGAAQRRERTANGM